MKTHLRILGNYLKWPIHFVRTLHDQCQEVLMLMTCMTLGSWTFSILFVFNSSWHASLARTHSDLWLWTISLMTLTWWMCSVKDLRRAYLKNKALYPTWQTLETSLEGLKEQRARERLDHLLQKAQGSKSKHRL